MTGPFIQAREITSEEQGSFKVLLKVQAKLNSTFTSTSNRHTRDLQTKLLHHPEKTNSELESILNSILFAVTVKARIRCLGPGLQLGCPFVL